MIDRDDLELAAIVVASCVAAWAMSAMFPEPAYVTHEMDELPGDSMTWQGQPYSQGMTLEAPWPPDYSTYAALGVVAQGKAQYRSGSATLVLDDSVAFHDDDLRDSTVVAWGDDGLTAARCVDDNTGATDTVTLSSALPASVPDGEVSYIAFATPSCPHDTEIAALSPDLAPIGITELSANAIAAAVWDEAPTPAVYAAIGTVSSDINAVSIDATTAASLDDIFDDGLSASCAMSLALAGMAGDVTTVGGDDSWTTNDRRFTVTCP